MKTEIIAGLAIIAGSLAGVIFLTLWCRHIIENLHLRHSKESKKDKTNSDDERNQEKKT